MRTLNIIKTQERVNSLKPRSAWGRGVQFYANWMLEKADDCEECGIAQINENIEKYFLNGAQNWQEASECALFYIYDVDIAKTLCTNSEKKRFIDTVNDWIKPNKYNWLEIQGRALYQAYRMIADNAEFCQD